MSFSGCEIFNGLEEISSALFVVDTINASIDVCQLNVSSILTNELRSIWSQLLGRQVDDLPRK